MALGGYSVAIPSGNSEWMAIPNGRPFRVDGCSEWMANLNERSFREGPKGDPRGPKGTHGDPGTLWCYSEVISDWMLNLEPPFAASAGSRAVDPRGTKGSQGREATNTPNYGYLSPGLFI